MAGGIELFLAVQNLAHRFVHQHADRDGFTFWGACGAIRRDIFHAVGGFDARYHEASVEDIELGIVFAAAVIASRWIDPKSLI